MLLRNFLKCNRYIAVLLVTTIRIYEHKVNIVYEYNVILQYSLPCCNIRNRSNGTVHPLNHTEAGCFYTDNLENEKSEKTRCLISSLIFS